MENIIKKIIIVLLIILIIKAIIGNFKLETNYYEISSNNLSSDFDGFTVIQISDFHNSKYNNDSNKILNIVKNNNPNIIVITGDFIDSRKTDVNTSLLLAKELILYSKVYYVTGNHESRLNIIYDEFEKQLIDLGVIVLRDSKDTIKINDSVISIIGLDDPDFVLKTNNDQGFILDDKLSKMDLDNNFKILLSHRPEYFKVYSKYNIDLVLSGHVHGGQFRIPFIGGLIGPSQGLFPKYDAGIYTRNNTQMIVSRGVGQSIIPIRINNNPEIVIVEFNSK